MRIYENKILRNIPVALIGLLLASSNPLHIPADEPAYADVIAITPEPRPMEMSPNLAKAYAQKLLLEKGFNSNEWACLEKTWTKESNWNFESVYERTEDYGIPQRHMSHNTKAEIKKFMANPYDQIEWGLNYIYKRYSTPCSAWRFWQENRWYQSTPVANENDDTSTLIDDALAELGRIAFTDPAICTSWVLISEWFDGSRDYWTLTLADNQQPEWRQLGLLHHAIKTWEDDIGEHIEEQ